MNDAMRPLSRARQLVAPAVILAAIVLCVGVPYYFGWFSPGYGWFGPASPPDIPIYPSAKNIDKKVGKEIDSSLHAVEYISFETSDNAMDVRRFYDDQLTRGEWGHHPNNGCGACSNLYVSHRHTDGGLPYMLSVSVAPVADSKVHVVLTLQQGIVTCDCISD
jgi:hypothetical protein